ncbi:MAG: cysteine desulfurase [Gammaproteobacteria bacterium]|nr:cysteine desulfurase [Gammaproteobacteria bacterium]
MSVAPSKMDMALDVNALREDFPILHQDVNGKPLAYLDNAATAQKPRAVIDAIRHYYEQDNANVHRGVHQLSERATKAYEGARDKLAKFLNAGSDRSVVFTRGNTEAINLVAQSYGRSFIGEGDEILITHMEHHSNIVPWQMLSQQTGAKLKVAPINERGELVMEEFRKLITDRTKLVGVVHVSNALGTINPVEDIIALAHEKDIPVLVDGAQATPHQRVDIEKLGADFYTIAGHKMFGPTGIGALIGRTELLEKMPPWQGGGDMIRMVTFEKSMFAPVPTKFEAGTPSIAEAIGLGATVDYLDKVGMENIAAWEAELLAYGNERLGAIDGLRFIGTAANKASVISFVLEGVHPHDIGTIVDQHGVAIRTGHHCAMPVMDFFDVPATARASFAFYNTKEEIDRLAEALEDCKRMLG